MSMLAERKIKQKWSLNPRGKAWSEDSNKFGQKMLEKMGWSKGKGLGRRENGISEHIKISYKNDSKGMGYKDKNDQWTEHDMNFSALLQSLSGEKPPENNYTVSSLEEKSQNSRVRVHYKKFTRGKDLSRCSEKDLANIFGKRSLKSAPKISDSEDSNETKDNETVERFVHNSGSMVDYFKKKLPNFGKNKGYVIGNNGVLTKNEESEDEERAGFGFAKKRKESDVTNGTPKRMRMEERDEELGLRNPAYDPMSGNCIGVQKHVLNTIVEENEETEVDVTVKKKTTKKVRQNKEKNEDEIINDDLGDEILQVKNNVSGNRDKKKNKQEKFEDNPSFEKTDEHSHNTQTNNTFEVQRKKKRKSNDATVDCQNNFVHQEVKIKKKGKHNDLSGGIENINFDNVECSETNSHNNDYEVKRKKKKKNENSEMESINSYHIDDQSSNHNIDSEIKKKKKKNKEVGIDNPNFDNIQETQNSIYNNDYEVTRKKKKKNQDSGLENPSFDNTDKSPNSSHNNDYEVKRKKKENNSSSQNSSQNSEWEIKRENKDRDNPSGIDNPNFDIMDASQSSYNDSTFEIKRKKKKRRDLSIDNPSFAASSDNNQISNTQEIEPKTQEEPCFDLVLNVTSTPVLPKQESSKQSSAKRRKSVRFSDVNEERIIPNNEDIENRNELFDINSRIIANGVNNSGENLDLEEMSKKIDGFQAEVENDINAAKASKFIGEVGNPDGENEKLSEGTRLKFKYAKFGNAPVFTNKNTSKAKTSYKHLIKGDVILGFKNTNLHEIVGYGVKK